MVLGAFWWVDIECPRVGSIFQAVTFKPADALFKASPKARALFDKAKAMRRLRERSVFKERFLSDRAAEVTVTP